MRKKPLFLLAFLLMLYISPMVFMPSYASSATLTEPNMNKDFALSVDYDVSEQSILGFDETLPDDVMFSPDLSIDSTKVFASAGEGLPNEAGLLSNTHVDDIHNLGGYDDTSPTVASVTLDFWGIQDEAEGIYYYLKLAAHSYNDDADLWIFNYEEGMNGVWELLIADIPTGPTYYSGSIYSTDYIQGGTVLLLFNGTTSGATVGCYFEYAYLSSLIMTLADEDHYAESFTDVSDWIGPETPTSDGDVGMWDVPGDVSYDRYYSNSISLVAGTYTMQLLTKDNDSATNYFHINCYSEDGGIGLSTEIKSNIYPTTDWVLHEVSFTTTHVIESVRISFIDTIDVAFFLDYLFIGLANESGWQNDCSTVTSTTTLRADVESDGDHIQFEYTGGGGTGELSFHTDFGGSAIAAIDTDYYPFIGWNVVNITGDFYEVYVDNTLVYTGMGLGLQHINVKASGEAEYTTITFVLHTVAESMALDWVKGYSIANWALTPSGCGVDDYLFVDSGVLNIVGDVFTYWQLDDDWNPNVDTDTYNVWEISKSGCDTNYNVYTGNWEGWSSESRDYFDGGTLTHQQLRIESAGTLSAIKFIDTHKFREVGEAELIFVVPVDETGINMFLIFLGLIMIPFSTLYLVRGGRSDMSMDKFFFGLIAFVIGWALFLGGIFG